jgi:hypothetical protein
MRTIRSVLCLLPTSLILFAGCIADDSGAPGEPFISGVDNSESSEMALTESEIIASRQDGQVLIRIPIERIGSVDLSVTADVALRDLDNVLIGRAMRQVTLSSDRTEVVLPVRGLDDALAEADLASVVIHYQVFSSVSMIFGRRSLYEAIEKRSIHLLSSDTFYDGQATHIRIVATEPVSGRPLSGARVEIYLNGDDSEQLVFSGETDEFGTLSAPVEASGDLLGNRTLVVVIDSELGSERIERPVRVQRADRVLITTDKPLYQPGQTIHIRTLSLRRGDLLPAARRDITIEVLDGNGNKILREIIETDRFGIASTELLLARELNMGEFIIRATLDETQSERTVTVDRYRLPRFTTSVTPDASYYRPGRDAEVLVRADYLFGEPVAGGELHAEIYQHDQGDQLIGTVDAELDENGTYLLDVEIPTVFAGQSLQQGDVYLDVIVNVTDGAGEERQGRAILRVAEQGILMVAIPAHDLLPGIENAFHILTTDPTGAALSVECNATYEGGAQRDLLTDARGTATIDLDLPADDDDFWFDLACLDAAGDLSQRLFSFDLSDAIDNGAIAIVTDGSLYAAGDPVEISIRTSADVERVFVDLIANNRTIATASIAVVDGAATHTIVLPLDLVGTVELLGFDMATGPVIRARRLIYVEPANDLHLSFSADQGEYLPGDDAVIEVNVTDQNGDGVAAAVGFQIVDEAVFALQDMRPGAERVFFQLEQEVLAPEYDVHGFGIGEVVTAGESSDADRERAAEILFAASQGSPGYGIVVDTLADQVAAVVSIVQGRMSTDRAAILEDARHMIQDEYEESWTAYDDSEAIILSFNNRYSDPWGQYYRFEPRYTYRQDVPDTFLMWAAGPDERFDTADDVQSTTFFEELLYDYRGDDEMVDAMNEEPMAGELDGGDRDGDMPPGEPMPDDQSAPDTDGGSGGDAPRVRSYFPETLMVEPALITDGDGTATIEVQMADSITTWRVTGMASSRSGQLGSSTAAIRVFQPFFLDIDFPPTLTQNDEVEVPVAVFNFLDEPQTISLEVVEVGGPWYELLSVGEVEVELQAGEVTSVPFRLRVDRVGVHAFQVNGSGGTFPDGVLRTVEVLPDGEEQVTVISDRLDRDVEVVVNIPIEAIENASRVIVKIYPGMFSQVVEGLESLLRMPSGCFEQTSSSTYPNVLALQYLRETGQGTPEVEERALEFISTGYQRLLSYEVPGGGFEWFGNTPAHRILSAYGLLEFSDMSEVFEVDPAVIQRTQQWLLSQREPDGHWRAAPEGIHEGATNNFTDSDLRATAYINFALLESGFSGPETDSATAWVIGQLDDMDDNYTMALVANMLISNDRSDSRIGTVLNRLAAKAEEDGDTIFWTSNSQSLTYGTGGGMAMETTALAMYAFIRAGSSPELVEGGVSYLVQNKDAFGTWQSTQATILSLRTFLALLDGEAEPSEATIHVFLDDDLVQTIQVDETNTDVVRQIDLQELIQTGDNTLRIEFDGEGSFLYQVVETHYLPWDDVTPEETGLEIVVDYPQDTVPVGEPATVSVRVVNRRDSRAEMVMVHVGVPPGFDVDMRTMTNHVSAGLFSRVDRTADGVEAYLYGIEAGETIDFELDVIPRMPLNVQTPVSVTYLYYEPEVRAESEPSMVIAQ